MLRNFCLQQSWDAQPGKEELEQLGRAELGMGSVVMARLQSLMDALNATESENVTTTDENATSGDAEFGNETHPEPHATGEAELSNETHPEPPATGAASEDHGEQGHSEEDSKAVASCGDPMSSTESFSCWLNKYKDPDDVEDFIKQHQELNTDAWYEKAKQNTFSMSDWLEHHVSHVDSSVQAE